MSDYSEEFNSEKAFKFQIKSRLWLAGFEFKSETNILGADNLFRSRAAYVDFVSRDKGGWFIECKLQMMHSDFLKGLGQCIYYRHILTGFSPFLVYPRLAVCSESIGMFRQVCESNGITLCDETEIVDLLAPIKDRPQFNPAPAKYAPDTLYAQVQAAAFGL